MKYLKFSFMLFTLAALALACDKDEDVRPVEQLKAEMVENLQADATQNADGTPRSKTNKFTLYSLKDNTIIANSDSATTKWDIGFRSTTIIVNGGSSGPGEAQAQVLNSIFDEVAEAPKDGYASDKPDALATQNNEGWYNYTGHTGTPANAIISIPGKTIAIKTAEGKYAKVEILSYYYGNPDTSTAEFADMQKRSPSRYYTFRYSYQADGGRTLKEANK